MSKEAFRGGWQPNDASRGLAIFGFLWGMYALLHLTFTYFRWFRFSGVEPVLGGAMYIAALALILRPGEVGRLAILAVCWVAYKGYLLPDIANHELLTVLINLTLLLAIGYRALRREAGGGLAAAVYADVAPLLRIELLLLYFYVVLHKLNGDFLNPSSSCGWSLYTQIADDLTFLPRWSWLQWPMVLGTLVIEAAIPVMLVWPRTRRAGLVLGVAFHMLLSLHSNLYIASFTSMLLALYSLFLPSAALERLTIADRAQGTAWARQVMTAAAVVALILGGAGAAAFAAQGAPLDRTELIRTLHRHGPEAARWLWFAWAVACMLVLGSVLKSGWPRSVPTAATLLRPRFTPALAVPVIVFLNGLCPYIGLKTESSFAMYSNLRTEGGRTNHLFMPVRFRLADYQEQLATVVDSSDRQLKRLAELGERLPLFELHRRVYRAKDPSFFVAFEYKGREHRMTAGGQTDLALSSITGAESRLARKLLHFRSVPPEGAPCSCRH